MFSFICSLFGGHSKTSSVARSFRPTLEGLEERQVPTVVAGAVDASSTFYINRTHDLSYDHRDGLGNDHWSLIDHNVKQVSVGIDAFALSGAHDVAFELKDDGSLLDRHGFNGGTPASYKIWASGVAQISASQTVPDRVYAVLTDGELLCHTGLNSQTGWTKIAVNVAKVQATQYSYNVDAALILYKSGVVQEYGLLDAGTTNQHVAITNVTTNVKDMSAGARSGWGEAYFLKTNDQLWRHEGFIAPYDSWVKVADNVATMSAGDPTGSIVGLVFVVGKDSKLTEYWGAQEQYHTFLNSGVSDVSAVLSIGVRPGQGTFVHDYFFMEKTDGSLWEGYDGALSHTVWHRCQ